ncbi:PAS domain S-box-containing protein [Symbiobacterium terraclitae]|uniref:PAS domain S-box-containing protein n=1 Tax=Symbiobacterium terraclitae TaxID=557451 RepID=A0ABS4JMD8_9FIRM|nr:sigma 54-interacting transcriptional regulator [Symbiobacterium terraclitae]MBP2016704.1 PAS domain S-box-containing protein [Symbiobacterium terraclitae]
MLNVVIIGAGKGGSSLLNALLKMSRRVRVLGVADRNPDAPGLALAASLGIPTTCDYTGLVCLPEVDIIVDATGQHGLDEELKRLKWPRAVVIEGLAMNLILSFVEESHRLLRALEEKELERDVMLDSTHDAIVAVNAEGVVTLCNRSAEQLLGVSREQVLGRRAEDVIPNTRLHVVLATGRAELNQQQEVGKTTIVTNRVPVRNKEGHVVGAVAVFRDISEVKALAEEISGLREMKVLLEAIFNSTQDAISVVDEKGIGWMVNPAYSALTGLRPEEVIGKPATVDIDPSQESMHLQVLRTRRPVRNVPLRVGPRKREVVVNVAPILVDGVLKGSVGVIRDVSEIARLSAELEQHRKLIRRLTSTYTFDEIIADSPVMQQAVEQARRAAETPATVLLRGESGTGKELFAHAIHNASSRRRGRFIRVNCAAIAESLLESELFGYAEGAFTGAKKGGKRGLFEEADGGTLFLDEIGELPMGLQAKLLRVLQEKEIVRVGEATPVKVDVRVIAATNAHLEEMIARGTFREDLYYRLNVVPIVIPPLRHRQEDIPRLVDHLIQKLNEEYGRNVREIAPDALEVLRQYHWPGNVRELENIIGRAMIAMAMTDTTIERRFLPPLGGPAATQTVRAPAGGGSGPVEPLHAVVAEAEKAALMRALAETNGNKTEAARRLQIAPRTLYYKLERYGLM